MTIDFLTAVAPLAFALVALSAAWLILKRDKALHERLMAERRLASESIAAFTDALNRFVDDPDAPDGLVDMLLDFGDAISEHDVALRLGEDLARGVGLRAPEPSARGPSELEALRRMRPDLAAVFESAIGSGLATLFLHWPENARSFAQVMTRLVADPSHGATHVWRARARLKADDRGGPFEAGQAVPA